MPPPPPAPQYQQTQSWDEQASKNAQRWAKESSGYAAQAQAQAARLGLAAGGVGDLASSVGHLSAAVQRMEERTALVQERDAARMRCLELEQALAERQQQLGAAGFAPNVVVFTTLLKGYAISGDLARAEELFAEMAAQAPPVPPDLRFINTFLRGCLRVGDAPRASETYRRMREEWGVAPDAASYRLLARLLSQNLQLPELRALVAEAEGAATATAAPPNAPPCMFWAQGRCDRGRNCAFWHDPAIVQDNAGQAAIEQLDTTARLQLALAHAEALLGGWAAAEEAAARAQDAQQRATEAAEEAEEELDGADGADDEPGGSLFSRTCVALLPVDHSCLSSSSADSWAGCAGHAMSWAARSIA